MASAFPKFDAGSACLIDAKSAEVESDQDTTASEVDDTPSSGTESDGLGGTQHIDTHSGLVLRRLEGNVTICGTMRKLPLVEAKDNTLMIWDWDDTLMPSTWLNVQGVSLTEEPSPDVRRQLGTLARDIERTLRLALSLGTVVVVTNAETGWVELSCARFFPSLVPLVRSLRVVSARSTYELQGVFTPLEWKVQAFAEEIRTFCSSTRPFVNVLSFGDSVHEREALMRSCEHLSTDSAVKSVKFPERPEAVSLRGTHSVLRNFLQTIVEHDGSLDLAASAQTRLTFFPAPA
jgi:hypothetical protein